jgi:hypothetical protein
LSEKSQYFFAKFFGENILKITTSVPAPIFVGETGPPEFCCRSGLYRFLFFGCKLFSVEAASGAARIARWFVFKPNIPSLVKFGRPWNM